MTLSRGIYENVETNYNLEEAKLLKSGTEINKLMKALESKDETETQ